MNWKRICSFVLGAIALLIGIYYTIDFITQKELNTIKKGIVISSEVVNTRRTQQDIKVIFQTEDGTTYTISNHLGFSSTTHLIRNIQQGDSIEVVYNVSEPQNAKINLFEEVYGMLIIILPFCILGCTFIWHSLFNREGWE